MLNGRRGFVSELSRTSLSAEGQCPRGGLVSAGRLRDTGLSAQRVRDMRQHDPVLRAIRTQRAWFYLYMRDYHTVNV